MHFKSLNVAQTNIIHPFHYLRCADFIEGYKSKCLDKQQLKVEEEMPVN